VSKDELFGILSLFGGVALFSTVEIASKIIGGRVDPLVLTFIRFFVTGVVLIGISIPLLSMRMEPFGWRDYGLFALNGLIGIAAAISLFHIAILMLAKAASAAVIFSVNPVFVLILSRFINKEGWAPRKWAAVLLGIAGVSCFAYESGVLSFASLKGLGLMVVSAFFFALSICISRRIVPRYGVTILMGYSSLIGSFMILPLALMRFPAQGLPGLAAAWLPVTYVVLAGTAVAYALYYFGILNTSAQTASMTFFLKPVLASVLAVAFLGETINPYMLTGTALILSGLIFTVFAPRRLLRSGA